MQVKIFLRILGGTTLGIAVIVGGVIVGARAADGPWGILAGGAFKTGTKYTGKEVDWSFVRDIDTIEFQSIEPERSRTPWGLPHDGRAFIPCGYMDSTWGRMWKQWPIEAERDGRAIVRIDGVLYDRYLTRTSDEETLRPVVAELFRKYLERPPPPDVTVASDTLWVFELAPRG